MVFIKGVAFVSCIILQTGVFDEWNAMLSIRLGLTGRTVRDNYLEPLIKEGIIAQTGDQLFFRGPPEDEDDGQEESD